MDPTALVIWALAAGSLALIVLLLVQGKTNRVEQRLSQLDADVLPGANTRSAQAKRAVPRLGNSQTVQDLEQADPRKQLRERMVQAGLYKPRAIGVFQVMRIVLCVAPIVAGIALSSTGMVTQRSGLLYGAFVGILGTVAPSLWLDHLKKNRQTKIRRALPDALDVIIVCLEAGLSISNALSRVARELTSAHPMLALELGIVEREIQMGRTTGSAVRQFAQRLDLEELRSLAAVISQAEQYGTSVSKAFNVYADTMRVQRHQRAEEMAQKAGVKILFPTLLCIFPGIFIVILGPAAIRIFQVIVQGAKNGTL